MRLLFIATAAVLMARAGCIGVGGDGFILSDVAGEVRGVSGGSATDLFVYTPAPGIPFHDVCGKGVAAVPDRAAVIRAMRAIPELVHASIDVVDVSGARMRRGDIRFSLATLPLPPEKDCRIPVSWRGEVINDARLTYPVLAKVSICVSRPVVKAARTIGTGTEIAADMVTAATLTEPPNTAAVRPGQIADVLGKKAARRIDSGEILDWRSIRNRELIARGQTVHVTVLSGGVRLRFDGEAVSAAEPGGIVLIRDTKSGRTFRAQADAQASAVITIDEDGL